MKKQKFKFRDLMITVILIILFAPLILANEAYILVHKKVCNTCK